MRKVKVVAGVFGILALGALGVIADGETYAPGVSDNMFEVLRTPVTAAASIETTTTAPPEKLTAAVSYETLAAAETASSLLTTSRTTTASAAETTTETTTVTTMTTVIETEAPETEAEEESNAEAVSEDADADQSAEGEETEESDEADNGSEETEEADEEPDETEPEDESDAEETEDIEEEDEEPSRAITITDAEYIMICNVVGHEYGANWISEYDKALVVEVIMNRVNSNKFPNTVYEVLMQKGQFPGLSRLINLGKFSKQVTPSVKAAVDLYLSHPEKFQHGYLFYSGDGHRNYFRTRA
jgi:cobalamin biosynthesis protein CobT